MCVLRLTEMTLAIDVLLLDVVFLEGRLHDLVDWGKVNVGHGQAPTKPMEYCNTTLTH